MERVVTQKQHSVKILEKTLIDLNMQQRQSEAKFQKELRDLGLDLSKLQKSTRDFDEFLQDPNPTPRPSGRRSSLPYIEGNLNIPYPIDPSGSPRSRRRLSIATVPVIPQQVTGQQANDFPVNINNLMEKAKSASVKRGGKSADGEYKRGGKPNKDANSGRERKLSSEVLKNNVDGKQNFKLEKQTPKGATSPAEGRNDVTDMTSAEEVNSDFAKQETFDVPDKRRIRRQSEPAISRVFLSTHEEFSSAKQHNGTESEDLKHSIKLNLPSDIVAEEEEDDELNRANSRTNGQSLDMATTRCANEETAKIKGNHSKLQQQNSINGKSRNKSTQKVLSNHRPRRLSEGDILKFAQVLTKQELARNGRNNGYQNAVRDSQELMWDSIRRCRYIRGHNPPEMTEPGDINQFVFGKSK
ncbi:uncharacterized protein LOC131954649 [Physella acuta]|uniref:uncharacterized protein LOC131954649 n=1 Tax=Physella acuta TaxID=109671 RepID=UPI0027DC9ADD|nr:uncharacterized protein LOC131954649 [Physella acuta]